MFSLKSSARNDCDFRRATNMVSIRVSFFGRFYLIFVFYILGALLGKQLYYRACWI